MSARRHLGPFLPGEGRKGSGDRGVADQPSGRGARDGGRPNGGGGGRGEGGGGFCRRGERAGEPRKPNSVPASRPVAVIPLVAPFAGRPRHPPPGGGPRG